MIELLTAPEVWAAFFALVTLEIILGIDNLIFISIVTNKLPEHQQVRARRIGISLALFLRLALLSIIAWLIGLSATVFDLGFTGNLNNYGKPSFETAFSYKDIILIVGGIFLVWKATTEIHHKVDPEPANTVFKAAKPKLGFSAAIVQIILLDLVFSIDSILTAVGMTTHLPVMIAAVVIAVGVMFLAAEPLARFIKNNPTIVMLALAFLLMLGMILIADGFGVHIPKGYIYAAMAFSVAVEFLNMASRRRPMITPKPQGENAISSTQENS
ncbi:MAG: TerC family protein [Hellea sp.]|nr:TerC family protein [Hyphomonadaceae bacterium]NNE57797.1 TerC family protein [Hellea sp.]